MDTNIYVVIRKIVTRKRHNQRISYKHIDSYPNGGKWMIKVIKESD